MKRLAWLIANCHTVRVDANDHRSHYATIAEEVEHDSYLPEAQRRFAPDSISPEVLAECIKRNVLVEVMVYPDTPIGSYVWYHYDIEAALAEAWAWAVTERGAPADLPGGGP